jgi:protein-S-isoprenylcysteine O-methyltransferase Ste14
MLILIVLSVVVGLSGIWEMRQSTLSVLPDVSDRAKLVTSGIYNHIRHPMYTAVLLFALGLMINIWTWLALNIFLVLLIDLILKAGFEERQLSQKFENYADYKKRTKRFVPFVIWVTS